MSGTHFCDELDMIVPGREAYCPHCCAEASEERALGWDDVVAGLQAVEEWRKVTGRWSSNRQWPLNHVEEVPRSITVVDSQDTVSRSVDNMNWQAYDDADYPPR